MAAPKFSDPILLAPDDLKANPTLTNQIATLANDATARNKEITPGVWDDEKWNRISRRFPDTQSIFDLLGSVGIATVILDENGATAGNGDGILVEVEASGSFKRGKVVACAAVVPWGGGWEKEGAATETGWEFKAVGVEGSERYLKKGLAIKLLQALERALIAKERAAVKDGKSKGTEMSKTGMLRLWILAVEETVGPYWRKRGYKEVRRSWASEGTWGCKKPFEMTVLRKDLEFELEPALPS